MIKAALIGLGNIAWRYDARKPDSPFPLSQAGALLAEPDIKLLGGCSPDKADRDDFLKWTPGTAVFQNPAAMLSALKPDLVGICSPSSLHYEHAMQCLKSGIKILWLEKPPTLNFGELEKLVNFASQQNATVCVNYFRRYLPYYQKLREIIENGKYGKVLGMNIGYSPGLARNGVHLLDQIFFLSGAEDYKLLWVEEDGDPQSPAFALRLPHGELVLASGGKLSYHTNDIAVQFEHGSASILNGGHCIKLQTSRENILFPGFFNLVEDKEELELPPAPDDYMRRSLKNLLEASRNLEKPASNLETALLSQRLLEDVLTKSGAMRR